MRGSGWIPAAAALTLWIMACAWPALALVFEVGLRSEAGESNVAMTPISALLVRSIGWAIAVTAPAILIGWWPGRLLGSMIGRRGFLALAVALAVPVCLPQYVVFWSWWQAWPPGTGIHEWAARRDIVPLVRQFTLLVSLSCWSWPIVAWCVAGCAAEAPPHGEDLLRMTGAPWWRRALIRLRHDSRGLLIGGLLVALFTFGNTVSFDLATVFTFGNELRAREALGASPRQLLATGLPAILTTVTASSLLWIVLNTPRRHRVLNQQQPSRRGAMIYTAIAWTASIVVPVVLLVVNILSLIGRDGLTPVRQFTDYYGSGFVNSLIIAGGTGALSASVALGLTMMWLDHRPAVRVAAHLQALTWLILGAMPATIAAMALEAAYNRPGLLHAAIYATPVVLLLGQVGRFAFIGVLIGRWLAMREPAELRDLRRIDDAGSLVLFVRATAPRLVPAVVATMAITAVLASGEITVTTGVRPGGFDVLAPSVLNAMHYQQVDTVLLAVAGQLLLAMLGALSLVLLLRRPMRRAAARSVLVFAVATLFMTGCSRDDGTGRPLDTERVFGAAGQSLGQFDYPRGLAYDRIHERVFIVDKSARIQRFTIDGEPERFWRMPAKANGKPTGLNVSPDGRVFVADTHYYRVIAYDEDGKELLRFGKYGEGPGQFIYPTDVEFGADGRIYVSEYGGNDRVQIFTAGGEFLSVFGSFGSEPGQFNRPQSMCFNRDRTRLYIADACNHRIQIFDPNGELLFGFGTLGREPGELSYPYDLCVLPDGTLLVCEFGNHRLQRFSADGDPLGTYGRHGYERGELKFPWAVDTDGKRVFALDSGNNRVQVIDVP